MSISSDVLPVFREYERSMATALNAYVQRLVGSLHGRLRTGLEETQRRRPAPGDEIERRRVRPAAGGPPGDQHGAVGPSRGLIGASFVARAAGFENAVTIDIGGTSADVSLIRAGAPASRLKAN